MLSPGVVRHKGESTRVMPPHVFTRKICHGVVRRKGESEYPAKDKGILCTLQLMLVHLHDNTAAAWIGTL